MCDGTQKQSVLGCGLGVFWGPGCEGTAESKECFLDGPQNS